jgi:hypothetical protein
METLIDETEVDEYDEYDIYDEVIATQHSINSGLCWRMEGSVGRHAHSLIESGLCLLGHNGVRDYYGNYVPSRKEVKNGTKGSPKFVKENLLRLENEGYSVPSYRKLAGLDRPKKATTPVAPPSAE